MPFPAATACCVTTSADVELKVPRLRLGQHQKENSRCWAIVVYKPSVYDFCLQISIYSIYVYG